MAEDNLESPGAPDGAAAGRDRPHPLHQKEGRDREPEGVDTSGAKLNHDESLSDADGSAADAHHDRRDGIHADAPVTEEQARRGAGSTPPERGRMGGRAPGGGASGADAGGET